MLESCRVEALPAESKTSADEALAGVVGGVGLAGVEICRPPIFLAILARRLGSWKSRLARL
jgi:hypothetical protein